jgi:hypothetical protein
MKPFSKHALSLVVMCSIALWASCNQREPADPFFKVSKKADQLYKQYLDGDINQARGSLESGIRLFEDSPGLTEAERAAGIKMRYMRLFALESRTGNKALEEAAVIKMNYWNLRSEELQGISTTEAVRDIGSFGTNSIIAAIDRDDQAHNGGQKADYLHYLRTSNAESIDKK